MAEWAWVTIGFVITFAALAGYTLKLCLRANAARRDQEQR